MENSQLRSSRSKTKRRSSSVKRSAARKITNFFRRTKHTRKATYLQTMCEHPEFCLAIGTLAEPIKKQFNGFTSFAYVVPNITAVGTSSTNGFLRQINYQHRGYEACAVLKSSKTAISDNLLYEYIVGQYINRLNKQFPCFLETYGYYRYSDEATWQDMQQTTPITDVGILKRLQPLLKGMEPAKNIDYNAACQNSTYLAILIQYFNNFQPLTDLSIDPTFIQNELMGALYQLYTPLSHLRNTFTHYDLHTGNVCMYQPDADKYIQYHYHAAYTGGFTVEFKSSYLLKIIDYGRSFFDDKVSGLNSKQIYEEKICQNAPACNDPDLPNTCGNNTGFYLLTDLNEEDPTESYYISSQKRNISHDLLPLIQIFRNNQIKNNLTAELKELLQKVVYTSLYGTAEIIPSGRSSDPDQIWNVRDAADYIEDYIMDQSFIDHNEAVYAGKAKLGDLHVYMDGKPMRFITAPR